MKPKKFFHCLLLAAITFLAAVTISCSRNEKKVAAAVSDANSECPMSVNKLGKCTAITYDKKGKKVVFHFTVDTGNMLWFDRASKKPDLLLRITVLGVIDYGIENPVLTKLFELLINCKANLEFAYQSLSGKEIVTVPLTYKKLKELRDNLRSETKFFVESLDILVEINRAAMPIEMGNGVWLKDMENGKENLKMVYELDEVNHDFDGFWRPESSMKEEYATEILTSDENRGLLEMLIMTGKGLEVTYKSNKGTQSVHLVYTAEELKKIKELWL